MNCHKKNSAKVAAQAQDLVAQATAAAADVAEKIRPVASHLAAEAKDLAVHGKEWAAPYVAEAAEWIRPVAEETVARASDARDKAVHEYLPKAKKVAHAAVEAVRETDGDLKTRVAAVQESAVAALKDKPKKKRRFLKLTGTLALIGGAAGAAVLLWKRSQPVEDPWAEAYWEDVTEAPEEEAAAEQAENGKHKA